MAFINIAQGERRKLYDYAVSYNNRKREKTARTAERYASLLYSEDGRILAEMYGLGADMSDPAKFSAFMNAWFLSQGMDEEDIISEDEDVMERKDELIARFHETFARNPEDTTDELNGRRLDAIFSIQAAIGRLEPLMPDLIHEEITEEEFSGYVELTDLAAEMSESVEGVLKAQKENIRAYKGIENVDKFVEDISYSSIFRGCKAVSDSLVDVFSSVPFRDNTAMNQTNAFYDAALRVDMDQRTEHLKNSLGVLENYESFLRRNSLNALNNTEVRNIYDRENFEATLSTVAKPSFNGYNRLFGDGYMPIGHIPQTSAFIKPPEDNAVSVDPLYFTFDDERLIRELTGDNVTPIDELLDKVYIDDKKITEDYPTLAQAAEAIRSTFEIHNDAEVVIEFDNNTQKVKKVASSPSSAYNEEIEALSSGVAELEADERASNEYFENRPDIKKAKSYLAYYNEEAQREGIGSELKDITEGRVHDTEKINTTLRKAEAADTLNNSSVRAADTSLADNKAFLASVLGEEITDDNASKLLSKLYINGRNIKSVLPQGTELNVKNASDMVRAALDAENKGDFVTVMRENSIEPDPVPIVSKAVLDDMMSTGSKDAADKLHASVNYVRDFRKNIYDAVMGMAKDKNDLRNRENLMMSAYNDFTYFAAEPFLQSGDKAAAKGVLSQLNKNLMLGMPGREPSFAGVLLAYTMAENDLTLDQVLADTPEMRNLRREMGAKFYADFSLPVKNREVVAKGSPEANEKFSKVMIPKLMNMAEHLSKQKMPYVDYSDPESIRENGITADIMGSMIMDLIQLNNKKAADMFRGVYPDSLRQLNTFRTQYIRDENYVEGIRSSVDGTYQRAVIAQAVTDNIGTDTMRDISDIPIGMLVGVTFHGYNSKAMSDNLDGEATNHMADQTLRTGIKNALASSDFHENFRRGNAEALTNYVSNYADSMHMPDGTSFSQQFRDIVANARNVSPDEVYNINRMGFIYRDSLASSAMDMDSYLNSDYSRGVDIIRDITSISVTNENSEANMKLLLAAADMIYIGGEPISKKWNLNENSTFADFEAASKNIVRAIDSSIIHGDSTDYVMVKHNDYYNDEVSFNAVRITAPVLYPPEKPEELSWFKKLVASDAEKEQNRKDLENYEKIKKEHDFRQELSDRSDAARRAADKFTKDMNAALTRQRSTVARNLDEISPSASNNLERTQPQQPTNTNEMTRQTGMGSPS